MEIYRRGQKVVLGALEPGKEKTAPIVCRFEVRRPNGTLVERDWEKKPFTVRTDQAGVWTWQMYIREELETRIEGGQFAVVAVRDNDSGGGVLSGIRRRLGRR